MTIREYIKRRVRRAMGMAVGSWLVLAVVGLLGSPAYPSLQHIMPLFAILGVIGFGGAIVSIARVRCPKCRASLGQTVAMPTALRVGGKQVNFCPFCGVNFDEPIPRKVE
jgi:hypothetical protein